MLESLREIWAYRALITEFVRRDLKLRYKNSVGGVAWSLFNPLMQIIVITQVMKFILPNPVKDYSAHLFILFLWAFIQVSVIDGCGAILNNAQLIRKIYGPRAILPLVTILNNLFHFAVAFAFTLAYFFARGTYPQHLRPEFLMVIPVVICAVVLCVGLALITSYLNVFYEDVRIIVSSLTGLFLYALPIFYPIEQVRAHPEIYAWYMLNPFATLLVTYQRALLAPPIVRNAHGEVLTPVGIPWDYFGFTCLLSIGVLWLGFALFEKYKWEIVERV
ncbi:MAG: lipopolysaccharide transport system permease protein [Abditibacteriota bacterium]|nr:lipopolysaccharide transport system permease protein [Abditibacteriota bacterium]